MTTLGGGVLPSPPPPSPSRARTWLVGRSPGRRQKESRAAARSPSPVSRGVHASWFLFVTLVALGVLVLVITSHPNLDGGWGSKDVARVEALVEQGAVQVLQNWHILGTDGKTDGKIVFQRPGSADARRLSALGGVAAEGDEESDSDAAGVADAAEAEDLSPEQRRLRAMWELGDKEKFMWYPAHGGFSNQLIQLRWALAIASLLNRTLILPPKLTHWNGVPSIGSCAKKPTPQWRLREAAWTAYSLLLLAPGYTSLGDILDVGSLPPPIVRTIDLRPFVSLYCGCHVGRACSGPFCRGMGRKEAPPIPTVRRCLARCGAKLGGESENGTASGKWIDRRQLYIMNFTCGDTVWTAGHYKSMVEMEVAVGENETTLLPFVHELARRGRGWPTPRNVVEELGEGTEAGKARVVAMGSMFHPRVADIKLTSLPQHVQEMREATDVLPFTSEIMRTGTHFARRSMGGAFACLHVRGGDSFFADSLAANLDFQKEALLKLRLDKKASWDSTGLLKLFLMTDIPRDKWNGTFLESLHVMGFDLKTASTLLKHMDAIGRRTLLREYGLLTNRVSRSDVEDPRKQNGWSDGRGQMRVKGFGTVPDLSLFVEQTICSCASLGFIGTQKSTASGHVHHMRAAKLCHHKLM